MGLEDDIFWTGLLYFYLMWSPVVVIGCVVLVLVVMLRFKRRIDAMERQLDGLDEIKAKLVAMEKQLT